MKKRKENQEVASLPEASRRIDPKTIGGSDVAAIVGKDPYKTALDVALRLCGVSEPEELDGRDVIEFGKEMEGVLARFYERRHGVSLYVPETIYHPDYPFLRANIDRRIQGNPAIGIECKNTGLYAQESWGAPGTDEVPERVILQVHHYMALDPVIECFHVLRCWGGNRYQEFVVNRDPSLCDSLIAIEVEFYRNVMAGNLPEPDWQHHTTKDAIRRAFSKVEGTIEAMPELAKWTECWEEAEKRAKETRALADSLKNHIEWLMGNAEVAILPDGRRWRRKLVSVSGYTVAPKQYIQLQLQKG